MKLKLTIDVIIIVCSEELIFLSSCFFYRLLNNHHDDASKFICLLAKPNCSSLEQEDFIPLLQVIFISF